MTSLVAALSADTSANEISPNTSSPGAAAPDAAQALAQLTVEDKGDGVLNLTDDDGVRKRIMKAGAGPCPSAGNQIQIHYTGTLAATGEEFDSSRHTAYPFAFELGANKVIKGWEIAVATMHVGERCELTLTAAYAYGDDGCDGDPPIPPGADLVFDVELIAVDSGPASSKGADMERLAALRLERAAKAQAKADAQAEKEARKAAALAKLAAKRQPKGKKKSKLSKKAKAKAAAEAAAAEEKAAKKAKKAAKKALKKEKKEKKKAAKAAAKAAEAVVGGGGDE